MIGGKLKATGSNAVLGKGDFIVAEADESDGSFLKFSPAIAVVTNIDREHMDFYADMDAIKDVFLRFIDRIPFYGHRGTCAWTTSLIQNILPSIQKRYTTYGMTAQADFQARDVSFEGLKKQTDRVSPGQSVRSHHLEPARPAQRTSMPWPALPSESELGIPFDVIKAALEHLEGVQRRLETKGSRNGVTVIDDYGHHPTEIKVTLETIKDAFPDKRVIVAFQPHRYSRTQALFDEFTRSHFINRMFWSYYRSLPPANSPIEGIDSLALFKGIQAHGHKEVVYQKPVSMPPTSYLTDILREGDILLTLGAGNIWQLGSRFLNA